METCIASGILGWIRLVRHPESMRRAGVAALTVGPILIAINHGPAILAGEVTGGRLAPMCRTVVVPFIVSTVSSVSTHRELMRNGVMEAKMPSD